MKKTSQDQLLTLTTFSREMFRDVLRDGLLSRQRWTFLSVGGMGLDILNAIEHERYWGRDNRFVEMSLLPAHVYGLGVLCLTFADKCRMSASQLSRHSCVVSRQGGKC
jgi:hypothetical protein